MIFFQLPRKFNYQGNYGHWSLDLINYHMKHIPEPSLFVLLSIFNTIWKLVIPIPKPGKGHTDPKNYRPTALTSCIFKTMERMINSRLV